VRINSQELEACEIDYFVGRIVTVMVRSTQRAMADPEEFHNMFTGEVVQQNHLGLWLLTSQGRKSFIFWHAVQGIFDERSVDPESREAKEALAEAERVRERLSRPRKQPHIQMPTIPAMSSQAHHGGCPGVGMPPGTPPELVQLTFEKLKERARQQAADEDAQAGD
jgi:hypothetical protein